MTDLIERLREAGTFCGPLSDVNHLFSEAADALSELQAVSEQFNATMADRNAEIAELQGRVERMGAALRQGAAWFDEYAESHQAQADTAPKGSHQHIVRYDKAERNRERAVHLRAALTPEPSHDQ